MRIDQLPVAAGVVNANTLPVNVAGSSQQVSIGELTNSIRDNVYGAPLTAATAADMTDTTKVYVYVGSETGYTNGNWYYYDGSAWVSGGAYNSTAVQTDTTLMLAGVPADAKATGDALRNLAAIPDAVLSALPTDTETGSVVDIAGTIELPLIDFAVYGKSTQVGTPSPTNPALIYNVGAFTPKNMLPGLASETTVDNVKYTPQADGTVKAVGTSNGTHPLYLMKNVAWNEGNYILSGGSELSSTGVRVTAAVHDGSRGTIYYETTSSTPATVIVYAGEQLDVYIRTAGGNVAINATIYPMLRYASVTDDTFEPYDSSHPVGVPVGTQLSVVTTGENMIPTNAELWESWASVVDYALDPETATVTVTAREVGDWPQAIAYIPCARAFRGRRVTLHVDSVEQSNSNHIWRIYLLSYNGSSESTVLGLPYSGSAPGSTTATVPSDCTRLRILFRIDQNRTHQVGDWARFGGVSIILADQYDGEVHPFQPVTTTTLPTPNGLPGIAVSSGGNYTDENDQQWVCDTIDLAAGTYTRRCGMIDLGDLSWSYNSTATVFWANVAGGKRPSGLICTVYPQSTVSRVEDMPDKTIWNYGYAYSPTNVVVKDSDYNNATVFKTAVSGALLLYVLATPVTTPLTSEQISALESIYGYAGFTRFVNDFDADMSAKMYIDVPTYVANLLNASST